LEAGCPVKSFGIWSLWDGPGLKSLALRFNLAKMGNPEFLRQCEGINVVRFPKEHRVCRPTLGPLPLAGESTPSWEEGVPPLFKRAGTKHFW